MFRTKFGRGNGSGLKKDMDRYVAILAVILRNGWTELLHRKGTNVDMNFTSSCHEHYCLPEYFVSRDLSLRKTGMCGCCFKRENSQLFIATFWPP
jgi:hypothetical protein